MRTQKRFRDYSRGVAQAIHSLIFVDIFIRQNVIGSGQVRACNSTRMAAPASQLAIPLHWAGILGSDVRYREPI